MIADPSGSWSPSTAEEYIDQALSEIPVADEEDLTCVEEGNNNVLKFRNKTYNSNTYSGLGRVYLRKNMVNGVNILTQDMLYKGDPGSRVPNINTIFIIQYDYSLNNATITIPEGCVLEFDGGSLSNGAIVGNFTKIDASLTIIFGNNLTTGGSWNIPEAYPEWFGAKTYGNVDCADAIEKAMQLVFYDAGSYPIHSVPVVLSGIYAVSRTVTLKPFTILKGQNPRFTGLRALSGFDGDFLFQTQEYTTGPNSRQGFECIGFDCNGQTSGVCLYGANELFICRNVEVTKFTTYGIFITKLTRTDEPGRTTATQNCLFEDLFIQTPTQEESYGLYLDVCTDSVFIRTTIDSNNNSTYGVKYGVYGVSCNSNTFIKLNTEDCLHPIYLTNPNCYDFSIRDYLCKNPVFDLAPYDDDIIAVIRTVTARNLSVTGYKLFANDVYKDINGDDVPDANSYKRYDLYNEGGPDLILPVTVSNNTKIGNFSVSGTLLSIDFGEGSFMNRNISFLYHKGDDMTPFKGIYNRLPLTIRTTNLSDLDFKGKVSFVDEINQLCYHNGNCVFKLKGVPDGYELGGLSSDKPIPSVRYEYEQYFDTQVDKLLNVVGGRWVDALGFSGVIKNGSTVERNNLISFNRFVPEDAGCPFFDKTLGKPVFLKVTGTGTEQDPYVYSWVDATGTVV